MPTRPIVKFEVALLGSGVLAALGKLLDERKLAVVADIDRARFVFRLADHCRERAQTHAVQSAEVDPFGRFSVEPGPGRHQLMKVGIGVSAVALGSLHRLS